MMEKAIMKENCNPDIYLNRPVQDYISIIRASVIFFCSSAPSALQDDYGITTFTCSELLKFIDKNLENKKLYLELN